MWLQESNALPKVVRVGEVLEMEIKVDKGWHPLLYYMP